MSGADYLDPLPKDFALAAASANAANALGLDTVQAIIDRLDRARAQLAAGQPADQLLPLSTFVKTGNAKVATSHKEWASAVNKFGKGVDKVRLSGTSSSSRPQLILLLDGDCRSSLRRWSQSSLLPAQIGRAHV